MSGGPKVMIVAGEASGDSHAAGLVREAKRRRPDIEFFGVGGPAMAAAGVRIVHPAEAIAHMGLVEVLRHLPTIVGVFLDLCRLLRRERPAWIVLVDLPDFNLRLAARARRLGTKVLYYVSPQVWAWRRGRVHSIARKVDTLMALFPFEPPLYAGTGLDVRFVGHPLLDQLSSEGLALAPEAERRDVIALVPGSRHSEIASLLPVMLDTAVRLRRDRPQLRFLLSVAPTVRTEWIESILRRRPEYADLPIERITGGAGRAMRRAFFSLVASGTSTLEGGLLAAPMVILYRLHAITWAVARRVVKVDYVGLINWVLGRAVVPERLQNRVEAGALCALVEDHLNHPEKADAMSRAMQPARERLGGPGASRRAAEVLLEKLEAEAC